MSKPNFKFNWRYALGELALIFLGISLAIAFQNWNDAKKKSKLESDLLKQLYEDIQNSLGDVEVDLGLLEQGIKSHYKIQDAFDMNTPYDKSMVFDFYFIQKDEYTYPIKINFERLKTIGLETITNEEIRYQLSQLYEFNIPRIEKQESFYPDISLHFQNFYNQNFKPNTDLEIKFELYLEGRGTLRYPRETEIPFRSELVTVGYEPLNFEGLKNDNEFAMLLEKGLEYRIYKVRQFNRIADSSKRILELIDQYLGRDKNALETE